ncbi:Uncharacterised protein [Mycobacteroides abscessus subsp. abscessus]|nr:Uncharacterised protein [Mycobacteroides abscessus subsp. abscessus]
MDRLVGAVALLESLWEGTEVAGAKLHHTVPQFYLRGFANDDDRIATVKLPGDCRFIQKIGSTAAINHFYSIDGHPDGSDAFERALSKLEGGAAAVLRTIVQGDWPLSAEQRLTLSTFLAVQTVRGPDHRRTMEYLSAQMTRLELTYTGRENVQDWAERRYGVELDEDEAEELWQRITRPEGPPITMTPIAHIAHIIEAANRLLPYILGRPWTLVRFDRRPLVTSDSPVGLMPAQWAEPWEGVGFATAQLITFPLTRKLGLVMGDGMLFAERNIPVHRLRAGEADESEPGTTAMARLINDLTVNSASEYIYHHPDDEHALPSPLPGPTRSNLAIPGHASG